MINISEKISSLRKAHNLTQEALGEAVGVSAQAVSKWEKGDSLPDISVIPDICRTFGISADTLIGSEGNMTAETYLEKAAKLCKDTPEKMGLIFKLAKNIAENDSLHISMTHAKDFMLADSRGFGMYFTNIEYVKNILSVDLNKSELLKFLSNAKAMKIFSLICINGRLNDGEIERLAGFSEQETEEQLFKLMKHSIIESVADEDGGTAYSISTRRGMALMGIMANISLSEPEGTKGVTTSYYNSHDPGMEKKFI